MILVKGIDERLQTTSVSVVSQISAATCWIPREIHSLEGTTMASLLYSSDQMEEWKERCMSLSGVGGGAAVSGQAVQRYLDRSHHKSQGCHYLTLFIDPTIGNNPPDPAFSSRPSFINHLVQVSKGATHSIIRQDADSTRSGFEVPGKQLHVRGFE